MRCGKGKEGGVMKPMLVLGAVFAVIATGCEGAKTVAKTVTVAGKTKTVAVTKTVTVAGTTKTGAGPPGETVQFGYIRSLTRNGDSYEMRFDPAWLLSGLTAQRAAVEDGVLEPGEPVPNDNYVVDEGHRLLTYRVPATARITVLTEGVSGTPIRLSELEQIVRGENPFGRPLFEPITTGFWVRVDIDTVRSLDQQYRP